MQRKLPKAFAFFATALFSMTGASVAGTVSGTAPAGAGSGLAPAKLTALVEELKCREQGPFKGIYWYCPDGRVLHAKDTAKCNDSQAIQHGALRDDIARYSKEGLWLGQLLAGVAPERWLDEPSGYFRLRQYLLQQHLVTTDDGWIFRRARFYRGAVQLEDEQMAGQKILLTLLERPAELGRHWWLARTLASSLPRPGANTTLSNKVRWGAYVLADSLTSFQPLRVKLHGNPELADTLRLQQFRAKTKMNRWEDSTFTALERDLRHFFGGGSTDELKRLAKHRGVANLRPLLDSALASTDAQRVKLMTQLLVDVRSRILRPALTPIQRLSLLDLSVALEEELLASAAASRPSTLAGALRQGRVLMDALSGVGLLEAWERDQLMGSLDSLVGTNSASLPPRELGRLFRSAVEWGGGMVRAHVKDEIDLYGGFEPKAARWSDELTRRSPLLELGETASRLEALAAQKLGTTSEDLAGARGMNPGIAFGKLVVVRGPIRDDYIFDAAAIYALEVPPASLKPVAGILTRSEGNPISHVQLLARNLGIPNAVLDPAALDRLESLSGKTVFLAVTASGRVVLTDSSATPAARLELVRKKVAERTKIKVDTKRLDLAERRLLSLDSLRMGHSGRICGPKAANLGELRYNFPDHVAPGFVIPFGVFRAHLEQKQKNGVTYLNHLRAIFASGAAPTADEKTRDRAMADSLEAFRQDVLKMPLLPEFLQALREAQKQAFGAGATAGGKAGKGTPGVFVRSDTNMEDLKDFTGAGLNKTVANVIGDGALQAAIREVWASPFTERSYLWRQKYLENPEELYPSILILQSVPSRASGVMVTAPVGGGPADSYLLSLSGGVGGAVDGQAAETRLLGSTGKSTLRAPAREPFATVLSPKGGTARSALAFARPLVDSAELAGIREMGEEIQGKMRVQGLPEPYDIELGVAGTPSKIYLFQVRPFNESKGGASRAFLEKMDEAARKPLQLSAEEVLP
jgi:hypothetical protein